MAHIKHFSDVIPSFKHGREMNKSMSKSFIFHNNEKYEEDMISVAKTTAEEICIVKYRDKGF